MKVSISSKKMSEFLDKYPGDEDTKERAWKAVVPEIGFTGNTVCLETSKIPKEFIQFILDHDGHLSEKQRVSLSTALRTEGASDDVILTKPSDVQNWLASLRLQEEYNAEYFLNKRWYPVRLKSSYSPPKLGVPAFVEIYVHLKIVDKNISDTFWVSDGNFQGDQGEEHPISGKEVLSQLGLRLIKQDIEQYKLKLSKARKKSIQTACIVGATNSVLIISKTGWKEELKSFPLGTPQVPKKVIIDQELESQQGNSRLYSLKESTELPFVRAFSLDLKSYVYLDVDDLVKYSFDRDAINYLILPEREKTLLSTLFTTDSELLFGDVLRDKHGGMIILANGSSGVGKTLTAEVFAEITERPLYVMEMRELGTQVSEIEQRLQRIFDRVFRWNAVLLLDEADILLYQRGESLERSIIVGIFLRLTDYYRGFLFLTSNRAENIDPAFKSRITIQIDYPNLTRPTRERIWEILLEKAQIEVEGSLSDLVDLELNGRQIRNMVRLTRVLHGSRVSTDQILQICEFACK